MVVRALIALALLCSLARADDAKPWVNVGEADQKKAFDLYAEGNALFEHDRYKEALVKYDEAIKVWDHPAIRFNAAVCLINLDRWLEADDYLTAAMRYGEEPLGHDLWRQAQMNMKTVEGKVADLDVKCDEPGATVTLDGEVLFTAPSSAHRRVLTDKTHQIIAQKKDYETETRAIKLEPGKETTLVLELHPLPQHRALVRRWSKWKPWAVTGAGAAVALVGAGFAFAANTHLSDYDKQVTANYTGHTDPNTPPPLPDGKLLDAGNRDANLAYGAFAVGGAIVVTGFVMVLLNQPHLAPMVTPVIGKEHAGAAVTFAW